MPNPPNDTITPPRVGDTADGAATNAAQRMSEQAWKPGESMAPRPVDRSAAGLMPMQLDNRQGEIDRIKSESVPNQVREIERQGGKAAPGDERQQQIFSAIRDRVLSARGPNGEPSLASQGWEVYQSAKDSPADKAHIDLVLVNKVTGKYVILDPKGRDEQAGEFWRKSIIKYSGSDFDGGAATNTFTDKLTNQLHELTKNPKLNVSDVPLPPLKKLDSAQDTLKSLEDYQAKLRASGDPALRQYAQDIQRSTNHTDTAARAEATPQSKRDAFDAQARDARADVMREVLGALAQGKQPLQDHNYRPSGFEIRGNDIIYKNGNDVFRVPVTKQDIQRAYKETRDAELQSISDNLTKQQDKLKQARREGDAQKEEKAKAEIKRLTERQDKVVNLKDAFTLTDDDLKKVAERIVTKLSTKTPEQLMGIPQPAAPSKVDAPPVTPPAKDTAGEKIAAALRGQDMKPGEEPGVLALAVEHALQEAKNLTPAERKDLEALRDGLEKGDAKSVERVTKLLQPEMPNFVNAKGEVMRSAVIEYLKNGLDERSPLNDAEKDKLAKLIDDYRANKPEAVRAVNEKLGIKNGGNGGEQVAAADTGKGGAIPGKVEAADHSLSPEKRAAEARYVVACRELGRDGLVRQLLEGRNIPSKEASELEKRLLSEDKETRDKARGELERRIGREGVEGLERDIRAEANKPGGGRFGEMGGRLGSVAIVAGALIQIFAGESEANTRTPEATWGAR